MRFIGIQSVPSVSHGKFQYFSPKYSRHPFAFSLNNFNVYTKCCQYYWSQPNCNKPMSSMVYTKRQYVNKVGIAEYCKRDRLDTIPSTDGQTDRQARWNQYIPLQMRWVGYNYVLYWQKWSQLFYFDIFLNMINVSRYKYSIMSFSDKTMRCTRVALQQNVPNSACWYILKREQCFTI